MPKGAARGTTAPAKVAHRPPGSHTARYNATATTPSRASLNLEQLQAAQSVLAQESWLPTPLLPASSIGARLGIDLWLKREDCTPIGSFKLRGALVTVAQRTEELKGRSVYVASAGNYGLAIAVAGQSRGIKVTVVAPIGATGSKLDRIRLEGAQVITHGDDFDTAKQFARRLALENGAVFWEDGIVEEMAWGAATIAGELLTHHEPWDAVIVPVGNGSLVKGIATVFKARSPQTSVVGVVASGAPAMAHALRGQPWDESHPVATHADGLAVRVPIPGIVQELKRLVDDVWLVDESRLLAAVKTLMELEQVMVEPSAAICIAGSADHRASLAGKRVAAVLTGAHLKPSLLDEILNCETVV